MENTPRCFNNTKTYWMTKISLRLKKNEEYLEVKSINTLVHKQH